MTQAQPPNKGSARRNHYWMRAVSFAGLHRILKAVAVFPNGLRAGEINKLVQEKSLVFTQRSSGPAPTTLYHYRNTLLRLRILKRDGLRLRINDDDPDVCKLLYQPAPANGDQVLSDSARDHFASLVLKNEQCRSLFFDLFIPEGASCSSVSSFRRNSFPVKWTRRSSYRIREVVFQNDKTGHKAYYTSPASITAILYGVRYWARNELGLIDEYCPKADGSVLMFPVSWPRSSPTGIDGPVRQTARSLLSLRTPDEWTSFSILDLIIRFCEARRRPIRVLFDAIDWLLRAWPNHIVLIPTSRALATLTAPSAQRETLVLRRYYKPSNGPYISHIRIHKDIALEPVELIDHHAQHASKIQAQY